MANYDFHDDIIEGELGEKIVLKDLESLGCNLISENKDRRYDLKVKTKKGREKTFEVKTDVLCTPQYDTGNLFVEFECRGKMSGINVTEAEYFVTYYKHFNEIWYIKTKDLLKLIYANNIEIKEFAGDIGSKTKGALVNRYKFKEHFTVRPVSK